MNRETRLKRIERTHKPPPDLPRVIVHSSVTPAGASRLDLIARPAYGQIFRRDNEPEADFLTRAARELELPRAEIEQAQTSTADKAKEKIFHALNEGRKSSGPLTPTKQRLFDTIRGNKA